MQRFGMGESGSRGRDRLVSVLVSFVAVRAGSATAAMGSLSTWQTLTTVAEHWFAELESV